MLLLLFSGVSFTRRLQRMYRAAWDREKAGVRSSMFAGLGLLVLVAEAAVLYAVRSLVRGLPLDWLLMIPLSAMAGLVLWTSIPWLLMNREVYWRRLIAAGALASTATTIYSVATAVYMPDLVDRYTAEFGLFGITIAIIGWLLVIAMVLVASSSIGAEFDSSPDPWAMSLKTRLRLYDPELGPLPAGAVGGQTPRGEFVNPFLLGRLVANWLVITFAVWLTASIAPGIVVYGGFVDLSVGLTASRPRQRGHRTGRRT